MQKSSIGVSRLGMLVFSDGALIIEEIIRFPERMSCVQRWEE
jgi:hypothetical protein